MSRELRQRPSSFLELEGYEAFCFDQACSSFGRRVQYELDRIRPKEDSKQRQERMKVEGLRQAKLNELLGIQAEKRFRDPASPGR